jgi:hypothetical protein
MCLLKLSVNYDTEAEVYNQREKHYALSREIFSGPQLFSELNAEWANRIFLNLFG